MTPKSIKNRSKIDPKSIRGPSKTRFRKNIKKWTVLERFWSSFWHPKSTKNRLCFFFFWSPSKNGVATILTSKTTPKWNQFRPLFENRRPCDFAAIYYTLERFCTSGGVKNPTKFRCVFGEVLFWGWESILSYFGGHFSTLFRHFFLPWKKSHFL